MLDARAARKSKEKIRKLEATTRKHKWQLRILEEDLRLEERPTDAEDAPTTPQRWYQPELPMPKG